MPWTTPTLRQVRTMVRDDVVAALSGATQLGNSVLRVMSDTKAGLAHLVLRYIDWLSRQLLPDTAEVEWLDRHGDIWLVNSDGSLGRKGATLASGIVTLTGSEGAIVPSGSQLVGVDSVGYETTQEVTIGAGATGVSVRALDSGSAANLTTGETISFSSTVSGVDDIATVVSLDGGTEEESDDLLRERILFRIQSPPMGGDLEDYVRWTLSIPGVTRAWAAQEMGIGTITVRFMMDILRVSNRGLPTPDDVVAVKAYLDTVRPVTVKDMFVQAPIPLFYDITISNLDIDNSSVRAKIETAIGAMELVKSKPGQTMYRSWVSEAISSAVGEDHHELAFTTTVMPDAGNMPFIETISYV